MVLKRRKKGRTAACLAVLFYLLGGCSGEKESSLDARIRQTFEELPAFTAEVKFLSDLGSSTLEYGGLYEYQKEGSDQLTLHTPEALDGIVIRVSGETADAMTVQFEDTVLDAGMPARAGVTPADAVPSILDALRAAAPQETWEETVGGVKMAAARYEAEDEQGKIMYQIWLTRDSLRPSYAECYADGERVLQIFFRDYQE